MQERGITCTGFHNRTECCQPGKAFKDVANITGIILTKLDGTSKGIIVSICSDLGIPVRLVGVGEGIDDLQTFNAKDYVKALFE